MKAEYKSAIRSRRLLREAFYALAEERDIRKITVTDLIRQAHVNRGTFYAHYDDMQDFLRAVMAERTEAFLAILDDLSGFDLPETPLPLFLRLSDFFSSDLKFYRLLHHSGLLTELMERLKALFMQRMRENPAIAPEVRQSAGFQSRLYFYVGGIAELYLAWLTGAMEETPETIARNASEIIKRSSLLF